MARLVRRLAPLLVAALCSAPAFALSETYEGLLVPDKGDKPIPITVELRDAGTFLTGKVKTSSPLEGEAPIEFGRNLAGQCNFSVALSLRGAALNTTISLRLFGSCEPAVFEGVYSLRGAQRGSVSRGRFHLTRKAPDQPKWDGTHSASASTKSIAACMTANTRCLTTCPRGDAEVESMCANRCRAKLHTCKGQAGKR